MIKFAIGVPTYNRAEMIEEMLIRCAELYQKEAAMSKKRTHSISLWFVPMILNFILFSLFAVFALLVISNPFISKLIAGICMYISFAGICITLLGVKRANLKENVIVHIQKRGILA